MRKKKKKNVFKDNINGRDPDIYDLWTKELEKDFFISSNQPFLKAAP